MLAALQGKQLHEHDEDDVREQSHAALSAAGVLAWAAS